MQRALQERVEIKRRERKATTEREKDNRKSKQRKTTEREKDNRKSKQTHMRTQISRMNVTLLCPLVLCSAVHRGCGLPHLQRLEGGVGEVGDVLGCQEHGHLLGQCGHHGDRSEENHQRECLMGHL